MDHLCPEAHIGFFEGGRDENHSEAPSKGFSGAEPTSVRKMLSLLFKLKV